MKNQIFISYSIDESLEMVKQIYNYLTLSKYLVFFDEKSVHTEEYDELIEKKVKECKDFVLILTPNLFDERQEKDWIQKQISLALKYRKNIVVVTTADIDHFPNNLPEKIKEINECPIIKLNEYQNWGKILLEKLSARPYFFFRRKVYEHNNPTMKWINSFLYRRATCIIFVYIIFCSLIRYTYSDDWKLPFWILRVFKALHELLLYQYILIMFFTVVAIRLIENLLKKEIADYVRERYPERNIDIFDLNFEPSHVLKKISLFNLKKYKNNLEKPIPIKYSADFWKYYRGWKGLTLGSLSGSNTDYLFLNYKIWTKIMILGISSRTRRNKAIRLLNQQKFEYTGCYYNNSLLEFSCGNYEIEILYGKIWPKVIELKPKKIKGTVKLMAIFQCLEFIDDERKVHKIDFLTSEFFQGKEYFIGIIPYKKFDKLSGNIVVLEDLSNGEYQFADFIIAEKIYQKIQKEMKKFIKM